MLRHSTFMDPTVGKFGGPIVEPIEVLTMDIHIPMEAIRMEAIPMEAMEDILLTPTGDITVRPISEDGATNATIGTTQAPFSARLGEGWHAVDKFSTRQRTFWRRFRLGHARRSPRARPIHR